MNKICIGDKLQIQCYKHDGNVHRCWEEAIVLDETKDYIVCGNDRTLVTRSEGVTWRTKEPAIMYFFKNEWYNVVVQLKNDGIYYYCNIASPYIIEEETIKYIDYDLDLRIFPSGDYKILDRMEYKYHKKIMNYSDDLDIAIKNGLDDLITRYKNGSKIFDSKANYEYHDKYVQIKNYNDKHNF